jgi:hypothetical protein
VKTLRQALVTILTADGTLQTLCGRTTNILVDWESLPEATLPVIGLFLVEEPLTGISGEHWDVRVQFACLADRDTGGMAMAEDLAARVLAVVTHTLLYAQGVDGAPVGLPVFRYLPASDVNLKDQVQRKDLELLIQVKVA